MLGEWVVTRPKLTLPMLPQIARTEGSGMVNVLGVIPSVLTADQALDLGHRLVEAGLGASASSRYGRRA
jgi:hypothetical protein